MSGHSKWSTIKRQKELTDKKRGQEYTRLSKQIFMAVKKGGDDPDNNFLLKMAISKARDADMPLDNISRSIKKASGLDKSSSAFEEVTYGAMVEGGVSLLIDVLTNNRHRSAADIKMIVEKNHGQWVEVGAVSWQFELLGRIIMLTESEKERISRVDMKWENSKSQYRKLEQNKETLEEFELTIIGIEGVSNFEIERDQELGVDAICIYTLPNMLADVRQSIEKLGYSCESVELIYHPKETVSLSEEVEKKANNLIELLEENEDVNNIWTNFI